MSTHGQIVLQGEFFDNLEIKKIMKIAGGDTYVLYYLRLLILASENNGWIRYKRIGDSLTEEIAMQLNAAEINIKGTISILGKMRLIECSHDCNEIYFKYYADSDQTNSLIPARESEGG